MVAAVFRAPVAVAEGVGEHRPDGSWPAERAAIAAAVPERRAEFLAVRDCARRALAQLGAAPCAILPAGGDGPLWATRAPVWPVGVVGAMTHCDGYRAAVVAPAGSVAALGVDAEPHDALPFGVDRVVLDDSERALVALLSAREPTVHWDRVFFSAKESVFKAWYPLTGRWLGFADCRLTARCAGGPSAGVLSATLGVPGPIVQGERLAGFTVRWSLRGAPGEPVHVLTGVTVPRR